MLGNKFLNDLVTRLHKLSKEELQYILEEVGYEVPLDVVVADENFDQPGGKTPK